DRENNLWLGTSGGGLQRFKPRRIHSFGAEGKVPQQVVSSVCASATGGVWVATSSQGLLRRSDCGVTKVALPREKEVVRLLESVLEDRLGRVWVGTYQRGLWLMEKEGTRMIPALEAGGDNVTTLFEDSRGRIWLAGGQSASVYDGGRFRVFGPQDGLPPGPISAFAEDKSGAIWLAHQDGVFRFEEARFALIKDESGSPLRDIGCLRGDASGAMWMGSNTRGLIRWRAGHLTTVGPAAGLPVSAIYSIIEDQHAIWWMASDAGVVRASLADLRAAADSPAASVRCQILDTGDGLPGKDFSTLHQPTSTRDAAGRLWFAMSKGVAVVDPDKFSVNEKPPPTHIEEASYFLPSSGAATGRQVQLRPPFPEKVSLPAGSRRLEIHYAGLSFVAPERVQFQVKLEGGDDAWQKPVNRRVAYFYDLPPRDYVFQVRAANSDGVWNDSAASLAFAVQPFLWQTWWFRVASGLLLAVTGGGAALGWNRAKRRQELAELNRAQRQSTALAALSLHPAVINGDCDAAFRMIIAQVASVIEIERVSLWLFDGAGNELRCANVHEHTAEKPPPQRVMQLTRYPRWLEALQLERTIDVADVRRDLRTSDLAADYLTPLGISALLAAPVRLHGRMAGVVCFEQRGPAREWHADELTFAAAVADQAGQTIANAERRQAEEKAQQQHEELAHLSRVTTVSELSGSLAHELNQPLAIILTNAQAALRLLAQQPPDLAEAREIIADIVSEDQRAGEVIRRLRSLLKHGETNLQPLTVNGIVEEALQLSRNSLIGRGVTVHRSLAPNLPQVQGDHIQLQQVLLNLILNACDAMSAHPPVGRQLTVATAHRDGTARISVSDTGCGLPPDVERIFHPFYTTKKHGLGLGLSICRSIITAHKGRLWAENSVAGGAVVHVELPAVKEGEGE
ncbi:MAG: ATP-binding protein, partial [Verrucomicrobia bacterium]|nr:ATP-binding protein [Verrucomicrobiota bacterium]